MEESPEIIKLRKLKEAIRSDLEKKTGRKSPEKSESRPKIQLSDDVKRRMMNNVVLPLRVEETKTYLDIERTCSEVPSHQIVEFIEKNLDKVRNHTASENLKTLLLLELNQFEEAAKQFGSIFISENSDYILYNLLLSRLLCGQEIEKETVEFLRDNPRSAYPFFLMIFHSLVRYRNFQYIKRIIPLLLKADPNELNALFFYMLQIDESSIIKNSSVLYRKNEYKEFQNIAKLLPLLLIKESSSFQYTLDSISKKSAHLCSKLYFEYFVHEQSASADDRSRCPLGVFLAGRKALQNKEVEKARKAMNLLLKSQDPYGHLLDVALDFGNANEKRALDKLHFLLSGFDKVIISWTAGQATLYKGLGLLTTPIRKSLEFVSIDSSSATFTTMMEGKLKMWDDFEVYLYPFEELRTFFGARCCEKAFLEKGGIL